ncbi:hypothetical protein Tco_1289290 [Tanacetum coccineum]
MLDPLIVPVETSSRLPHVAQNVAKEDQITVKPGFSLRTFMGHSASVMSLDLHLNKADTICLCYGDMYNQHHLEEESKGGREPVETKSPARATKKRGTTDGVAFQKSGGGKRLIKELSKPVGLPECLQAPGRLDLMPNVEQNFRLKWENGVIYFSSFAMLEALS